MNTVTENQILESVNPASDFARCPKCHCSGQVLKRFGGEAGSHLQQGGIALLDSFHDLQYYFRSEYLGDKPNAQKLLKIAKEFTNNN